MRCAVVGSGSWGTALAIQLGRLGHAVEVWDRNPDRSAEQETLRENRRYLPGIRVPDTLHFTASLEQALTGADLVVAVVPSQVMRTVMAEAQQWLPPTALIAIASKGVEEGSLDTMDEVLHAVLSPDYHPNITVLSGPSFALEVARGLPTAVVVAGRYEPSAHQVCEAFHGGNFRVYYSDDPIGVEVGAALKNVMAIACGISDGAGLGLNARAGIITRGLAEMSRLATRMGGNPMTLAGLAGMGDLVLTCTGDLSRNRRVGLALGQGRTLEDILKELGQVAEGVVTARSAWRLGQRELVELPITEQVYKILYEHRPVQDGLAELMGRRRKAELG